ncbi:MAG: hypothetical protein LUE21_05665 [Oscillospiraceae bacterium]|nr:hypothetical protein [Oscillospiraceae bacterium]
MKRSAKFLALLLVFCLVLSLGAFASSEASGEASAETAAAGDFAQVDETHWAGSALTIESIEYAEEFTDAGYVDSTLFTSITKIVYDGGEIDVDYTTYTAVLTVDGVQVDLYNAEGESFSGEVEITLVEKGDYNSNTGAPIGADKAQSSFGSFYYTAAIYIGDGAYDEAKSVTAAQLDGEVSDTEANGVVVDSQGDYFTGIYICDSEYTINDANLSFVGAGGDDFNGWGAGIVVTGASQVEINRSVVYSTGVIRSGLYTGGSSQTSVNDSVIISENDEDANPYDTEDNYAVPMMQQCPFALGIEGNIRASLACGAGTNTFTNSLVVSNGWAVLSTDSGTAGTTALVANSMVAVVGTASDEETEDYDFTYDVNDTTWYVTVGRYGETSGYIAYADSGVLDYAYGSAWYSPDYLGIITTGAIIMSDNSYGWSGRIGFLLHSGGNGNGTGTLTVSDSSFDIQNIFAAIQTQGTYSTVITLDNVDVSLAGNGVDILVLQTNSDDNAGGPAETSNTITDLTYEEYLAQDVLEQTGTASEVTISNSVVQGNIYNASTDDAVGLNVTLDNAEVSGEISSAWAYHTDADGNALDETEFALDYYTGTIDGSSGTWDYTMYLREDAISAPTVNNPVSLTLTNGSTWMVTGTNYLTSLTIDETSTVMGMSLVMTVDGVETEIAAGTYEGEIIITGAEAPAREEGDAEIAAPVIGEAAEVEVEAAAAFEADYSYEPFDVDVGEGMVLSFSSVEYALGDGTVSIYIADTSKQIDCEIVDGEWIMEGSDAVDEAIIAAAKAIYEAEFAGEAGEAASDDASAEAVASEGDWEGYIAYLTDLVNTDTTTDIYSQLISELAEAQEADYTGLEDGTMYGAINALYTCMTYEEYLAQ